MSRRLGPRLLLEQTQDLRVYEVQDPTGAARGFPKTRALASALAAKVAHEAGTATIHEPGGGMVLVTKDGREVEL